MIIIRISLFSLEIYILFQRTFYLYGFVKCSKVFLQRRSVRVENIFNWIYIGRAGRGSIINIISCNQISSNPLNLTKNKCTPAKSTRSMTSRHA